MFNFFKSSPASIVKRQFTIWHDACVMFLPGKDIHLLDEPRPKLGACLFFIGSIDYLCQNHGVDDSDFAKITDSLLSKDVYPSWLVASVMVNFYAKDKKPKFALDANLEGGKRLGEFLRGENKMAPYVFSSLVREWAENPELTADELPLFERANDTQI